MRLVSTDPKGTGASRSYCSSSLKMDDLFHYWHNTAEHTSTMLMELGKVLIWDHLDKFYYRVIIVKYNIFIVLHTDSFALKISCSKLLLD